MIDEMVANKINKNEAKINNDTKMKVEAWGKEGRKVHSRAEVTVASSISRRSDRLLIFM